MMRCLLICAMLMLQHTPHLIVMGDSIAVGVGASTPDRSWAAIVARDLGLPLTNVAISGSRVAEQPIPDVAAGDTVIWFVGFNDMRAGTDLATFRATVVRGVDQLQQRGAHVILVSGLRMPLGGYTAYAPQWSNGSDDQAARYAASVRDLATFVDLASVAPTTADLVHPDDAGHAAIAAAILTPNLTAQWIQDQRVLHLTWQAPGWHCLYIDDAPLTCGANSGALDLPSGGVDVAYAPIPGRALYLVSGEGTKTAQGVVPARVYRVWLPGVVR